MTPVLVLSFKEYFIFLTPLIVFVGVKDLLMKRVPGWAITFIWFLMSIWIITAAAFSGVWHPLILWFAVISWIFVKMMEKEEEGEGLFYYGIKYPLADLLFLSLLGMFIDLSLGGILNYLLAAGLFIAICKIVDVWIKVLLENKEEIINLYPAPVRLLLRFGFAFLEQRQEEGYPVWFLFMLLWIICYLINPFGGLYLSPSLYIGEKGLLSFLMQ